MSYLFLSYHCLSESRQLHEGCLFARSCELLAFCPTIPWTLQKKLLVAMVVFSLLPLVIHTSWTMARYILQFYVIFFGGLFLSFIIHEYLHAILLKKSREEGELEVEFTFAKITIYPKFTLTSKEMMKVAAMPLFILLVIGLVLIIFAKWTNQNFLMFTGFFCMCSMLLTSFHHLVME